MEGLVIPDNDAPHVAMSDIDQCIPFLRHHNATHEHRKRIVGVEECISRQEACRIVRRARIGLNGRCVIGNLDSQKSQIVREQLGRQVEMD